MSAVTGLDHRREFAAAWADTRHTRFELPPADINKLLADRYATGSPLSFTRDMLWDVEVRKAWQPDRYIPGVVRAGSARGCSRASTAWCWSRPTSTTRPSMPPSSALPSLPTRTGNRCTPMRGRHCSTSSTGSTARSEEHTSELQSRPHLVCRLLLEKK